MNGTLPLFSDLEPDRAPATSSGPDPRVRPQRARDRSGDRDDAHLRAAWRLSRSMWRYPDHSAEQTRAGLAICHHLQALLAHSESRSR